ncbi:hypothetical protein FB446DRAFT_11566 [Lentinula raphanica]|nr:hypothetical protein FB446DRAFT_11566 [Lentinula raphanica]
MRFTKYIPFACALVSVVYAAPMNAPQGSVSEPSGHTGTVFNVVIQWDDAVKVHGGIVDMAWMRSANIVPTSHSTQEHQSPHGTPEHPTPPESEQLPEDSIAIAKEGASWMPRTVNRQKFNDLLPIVVNNVKTNTMDFVDGELKRHDFSLWFHWYGCPTIDLQKPLEYAVVAEFGTYKVLQSHNVYDDGVEPYVLVTSEYPSKRVIRRHGDRELVFHTVR